MPFCDIFIPYRSIKMAEIFIYSTHFTTAYDDWGNLAAIKSGGI